MPGAHLTTPELADELGRSESWLYANWPRLVEQGMPRPLHATNPLVWSRAQIYAWLDRALTKEARVAAAAYRAAAAAAAETPHKRRSDEARWTDRLDRSLAPDRAD